MLTVTESGLNRQSSMTSTTMQNFHIQHVYSVWGNQDQIVPNMLAWHLRALSPTLSSTSKFLTHPLLKWLTGQLSEHWSLDTLTNLHASQKICDRMMRTLFLQIKCARTHTHTYTPKRWVLKLLNILGKTLVAQMTDGMKNLWPKAQKAEERHAHTSTTPPKSRAAEPWEWGWGGGGGTPQHCDQYQAREGWEGWTLWGQRHKVTRGSAKRNMVPYTARCSTREDRWLSWTGSEWLAWQGQLTEEGVTWIMWWFDKRP